MKIVVFHSKPASHFFGIGAKLPSGEIGELTGLTGRSYLTAYEILSCLDLEGNFLEQAEERVAINDFQAVYSASEVRLAAPVPRPGKVICIGLNYRDHAEESGMAIPTSPIVFSKFPSCVIGSGDAIGIPAGSSQVDYETELAFVIGRRARNVVAAEWKQYVLGYTNFNDVSARDFQFADGQWQRGKSCETFAPMGEFIATTDEILDPHNLRIRLHLNGETLQDSNTDQLIFKMPELIEFLSSFVTLEPGDVVATGTPPGVGFARKPPVFMKGGDFVEVEIDGLGVLANTVKEFADV
jgi:2-keto-4-pentenoate hydratase/2-oxohepta-3-ene-1,7-dioic acid hydratase in catechol pathway